ncbi:MAG: N-acetyl sugar amidotransferase [Candidatus Nitrohelix vancouverensis]|uniref:N-acetyl sugar amidotransferase n=1 Tax=Candidatus Nitrohelix vancouverensis TaxID=2705534 RepID=A0A7T0G275_9BACT|nr:MAG: N-acetyl sugar amidotransferase [Candidatus Nitrohelix vancouverensis]
MSFFSGKFVNDKKSTFFTLDKQFDELPQEVQFCANCVVSNQRPRTIFNAEGVCSACQWAWEKDHVVDWELRQKELKELCDRFRSKDGSYDVIVPGSGGKDSAFVAHQLKHRFKMNPLCVTWAPFEWTNIGWTNLTNFIKSGFFNIVGHPNGILHRKLARLAFEVKGDAWEPFAYGQKAWAYHMAQAFGIKLIFYGENGELEYGGSTQYKDAPKERPEDWLRQYYKGSHVDDLVRVGLDKGILSKEESISPDLKWYKAPAPEVIEDLGLEMHWFSYYEKWTPQENFYYAVKHTGFQLNDEGRTESTYTKYSSLDDKLDGFHFYLGYMKFGLGRASRDAQQDIRRHHITREEGVILVNRYDHEFPRKHFRWMLDYLQLTEEFFWQVMDFYRSQSNVWERVNGEWKLKSIVS